MKKSLGIIALLVGGARWRNRYSRTFTQSRSSTQTGSLSMEPDRLHTRLAIPVPSPISP